MAVSRIMGFRIHKTPLIMHQPESELTDVHTTTYRDVGALFSETVTRATQDSYSSTEFAVKSGRT